MKILWLGLVGVFTLSLVVMLGEDLLGETFEKLSTMLGAMIVETRGLVIAFLHVRSSIELSEVTSSDYRSPLFRRSGTPKGRLASQAGEH
jgi:hypothetical protein